MTTLEQSKDLFYRVLDSDYVSINITKISLEDDLESFSSTATIQLQSGETFSGNGKGIVDAVFNALFSHYSNEFQSLKSIEMTRFIIEVDQKTKLDTLISSLCRVSVETINSNGKKFFFTESSRSVATSAAKCASRVAEHFINSEKAYAVILLAYKDSIERNRQDLIPKYLETLSLLVQNTSYSHVVESIENEIKRSKG